MPDFNAQNTDSENAKGIPSVTNRGGVKLVSSKSAQAIAREDNRDTKNGAGEGNRSFSSREGGENPGASIK